MPAVVLPLPVLQSSRANEVRALEKREAVLLASRVLAFIQFMAAAQEALYIPGKFMWLLHYARTATLPGMSTTLQTQGIDLLMLLLRTALLCAAGVLLIRCGPRISRFLLPALPVDESERSA